MERTDVVIVGGGAMGCATAYFLAKAGIKVTVLESNAVAFGASGYAMGLLNPISGAGIPGPLEELSREGFMMHCDLAGELKEAGGIDYRAQRRDSIHPAFTDEDVRDLEAMARYSDRVEGVSCRWLDGPEVRSLEPRVSEGVSRALLLEGTLLLESHDYTQALARGAEKYGATIRQARVQGLKRSGDILEVGIEDGSIEAERVVLAMGPWAEAAQEWLGLPIPVYPLKGQILRLELPDPPLQRSLHHGDNYVGSKPDGLVWAGTTEEEEGFDDRPTEEARAKILREVVAFFPAVEQGRLVLQTACLRPVTPDGLPILGQVPGWDGVYLATGAGRKGILVSPSMARATAELITTGRSELAVDIFSPGRFVQAPSS